MYSNDYRDYKAICNLIMEKLERNDSAGDIAFLIERVKGTIEAAEENRDSFEDLDIYLGCLLDTFKQLVHAAYSENCDSWVRIPRKLPPERAEEEERLLSLDKIDFDFAEKYFKPLCIALCENVIQFQDRCRAENSEDAVQNVAKLRKSLDDVLHDFKIFKERLLKIETKVKEIILEPWLSQKGKNEKPIKYLLVNAATRVSDIFRGEDTISASIIDLDRPHWFDEESRHVLFVYDADVNNIVGMFPKDSSTFYDNEGFESADATLAQLLAYDGLTGKKRLRCNYTGYRPAYPLDQIVGTNDGQKTEVAEVVLNSNAHPTAIIVVLDERADYNLDDAKAYKQLFPETKIYALQRVKLTELN